MEEDDREEDDRELLVMGDIYGLPRGRCRACTGCRLWRKRATGPFAHRTCEACNCPTAEHEDLSPLLRAAVEGSKMQASLVLQKGIPLEAFEQGWSPLGLRFFLETGGVFHPVNHGRSARSNRIGTRLGSAAADDVLCSVICPTSDKRHAFHSSLLQCFRRQSHKSRELIVIDTGTKPSSFFEGQARQDKSVVYRWFGSVDWSIGLKRNISCFLAKGDIIAHFDDDDLYAETYLEKMVLEVLSAAQGCETKQAASAGGDGKVEHVADEGEEVEEEQVADVGEEVTDAGEEGKEVAQPLVAATLASWHTFDAQEEVFRYLNAVAENWIYGWGFSFLYTKECWRACPFPDMDVGEDYEFMKKLRKQPNSLILTPRETAAICSHTYHPGVNVSGGEKTKDKQPIGTKVPMPDTLRPFLPALLEAIKCAKTQKRGSQRPQTQPSRPSREPRSKSPNPELTVDQLISCQDDFIRAFFEEGFQLKLHELYGMARTSVAHKEAFTKFLVDAQMPILIKYGFSGTQNGARRCLAQCMFFEQTSLACDQLFDESSHPIAGRECTIRE